MENVKLTVNEYDVSMIEIKTDNKYPIFVSVKKALAVLETNDKPELIVPTRKYGRDLYRVGYGDEKNTSFLMGETKISAILDNAEAINKVVA